MSSKVSPDSLFHSTFIGWWTNHKYKAFSQIFTSQRGGNGCKPINSRGVLPVQTICKREGGVGQKYGKFANVIYEHSLSRIGISSEKKLHGLAGPFQRFVLHKLFACIDLALKACGCVVQCRPSMKCCMPLLRMGHKHLLNFVVSDPELEAVAFIWYILCLE